MWQFRKIVVLVFLLILSSGNSYAARVGPGQLVCVNKSSGGPPFWPVLWDESHPLTWISDEKIGQEKNGQVVLFGKFIQPDHENMRFYVNKNMGSDGGLPAWTPLTFSSIDAADAFCKKLKQICVDQLKDKFQPDDYPAIYQKVLMSVEDLAVQLSDGSGHKCPQGE